LQPQNPYLISAVDPFIWLVIVLYFSFFAAGNLGSFMVSRTSFSCHTIRLTYIVTRTILQWDLRIYWWMQRVEWNGFLAWNNWRWYKDGCWVFLREYKGQI